MNKPIRTYDDLVEEKQRLQALLKWQKEELHEDIRELGEELKPIRSALSVAGKLFTRDNNNWVLNTGVNTLIDVVVKKMLLSKTGWITKLVVPFILKNYSSHVIADNKGSIMNKLFSWIGKKNANGKEELHN